MEVEDLDRLEHDFVPDELRFPEIKDVYTVPWTNYSLIDQSELMTFAHSATPGLIVGLTDCERPDGMD
ncbi:hypothetical protein NC651_007760 [Populus alba x Populus x berolinensis]|nr:hypothetical protein NC651_007760 [Populus alba x Populus x berolinensis]